MTDVSNKEARGVTMPHPDNATPVDPAVATDAPLTTTAGPAVIEQSDTEEIYTGRMTKFVPSEDFTGYPDGKTKTAYVKDIEAEAPSNYVKLLKAKGHTA